ncbi:MAG TPA: peptidyl-prolyl cis-trans isomerase [Solirubrobacteraceae bacterium]|nr:peptidyl-prolyl cis-trans isomerase [Solirubrobacteraceae bacterium]
MTKAVRLVLTLCVLGTTAVLAAGCGDAVPGNSVASVDGNEIKKEDFNHWMLVAAKSTGQPNASVPDAPEYTKCIAAKRKTLPKPAKGQPETTDKQLKDQCKQEYDALRDQVMQLLTRFQWIDGEAEERNIKITDAEVKKSFEEQKKTAFPKEADYQKFLKQNGQTEEDILARVRLDLLSNKIRDEIIKGKDKVSDAQIKDFYDKNKDRFAQPERRDLRVVLTKTEAKANEAKDALDSGQSWKDVAKKYSIDEASKAQGGKQPAQAKGTLERSLDEAVFSADKGKIVGPVKTQFGYYVFEVENVTKASQQTLEQAKETIRQTLQSQNQQKALDAFLKDWEKKWKERTECREGYVTAVCKGGKATPTPTPAGAQPVQPTATPQN